MIRISVLVMLPARFCDSHLGNCHPHLDRHPLESGSRGRYSSELPRPRPPFSLASSLSLPANQVGQSPDSSPVCSAYVPELSFKKITYQLVKHVLLSKRCTDDPVLTGKPCISNLQ